MGFLDRTRFGAHMISASDEVMTGEIALPAVAHGTLALQVTLIDKHGRSYAQWEFDPVPASAQMRLRVDLGMLDQGSILMSGGFGNPVSKGFAVHALPNAETDLFLHVGNATGYPAFERICRLEFGSREAAELTLRTWRGALTAPAQWFYVELTTFCNLECPFCPSKNLKRPRQHMSLDLARTIFDKISDYLARQNLREAYVQFRPMVFLHVMGEPVLHPKLPDVIKIAHEAGLAVGLFTNVTLLNAKNIAKLIDARPELVTLSVNAHEETGYTELGANDTLDDQHRRVEAYLSARADGQAFGTSVDLQYMTGANASVNGRGLLRENSDIWRLYESWYRRLRALHRKLPSSARTVAYVQPGALANPFALRSDPTLRLPLGHGINLAVKTGCSFGNAALPAGMTVRPTVHGKCPFNSPFQQMSIFVDGSVSFCNLDYENTVNLGNLQTSSIEEIWNSARMTKIRDAMTAGRLIEPVCQKCLGLVIHS